jgi:hypothetical protein
MYSKRNTAKAERYRFTIAGDILISRLRISVMIFLGCSKACNKLGNYSGS